MLTGWVDAFAVAFGVVLLAELGDKTQLVVLAFSTRYRALPVVVGVALGAGLLMAASAAVGAALGAFIPDGVVQLVGGVLFLAFAAWTLLGADDDDAHTHADASLARGRRSAVRVAVLVAAGFAVAELGDKSMLAVLALAAQADPLATWAGATAAEIGASLVAILVGRQIGRRVSRRVLRLASAGAFAVFGVLLLIEALAA